jgi:hypothetical protein
MTEEVKISIDDARKLAVIKQHLSQSRRSSGNSASDKIIGVMRDIGYLQIDPISTVAKNPLLVLWSRIGNFDKNHLNRLLWKERSLFEYRAHAASIVMTEDYPIYRRAMKDYANSNSTAYHEKTLSWMKSNERLAKRIKTTLKKSGPVPSREIEDESDIGWKSTGWSNERNVNRMLELMLYKGEVMVAERLEGGQKLWDLAERVLPAWTPRGELTEEEVERTCIQKSLKAMGVATAAEIASHFIPRRYTQLEKLLKRLVKEGIIAPARIIEDGNAVNDRQYIHTDDTDTIDDIDRQWQGRTTLLSPFDNLIIDRKRTSRLFGYDFKMEIYVPRALRKYGYYVMSILHDDRLVGRIDPEFDKSTGRLKINSIFEESGIRFSTEMVKQCSNSVRELASFLGAERITASGKLQSRWKAELEGIV